MRSIVFDHGNLQAVQVFEVAWLCTTFVGEDDDGEVEVRASEGQVGLALGGGHDAGQQVDAVFARLRQYLGPAAGFDRFERHTQALLDRGDVIGGQSLVPALLVAKLERWPRGVYTQAQLRMGSQPGFLLVCQGQGAGRCVPQNQEQQQDGRHQGHSGLAFRGSEVECRRALLQVCGGGGLFCLR
ncbi:hypothetical protein D3C77_563320 [compost metagenome]